MRLKLTFLGVALLCVCSTVSVTAQESQDVRKAWHYRSEGQDLVLYDAGNGDWGDVR